MRITAFDIAPIRLVKDDPTWKFALGGTPASEGFIVRVTTDHGLTGFGSCAAATYYGLTLGGLRGALEMFRPAIVGREAWDATGAAGAMEGILKGHERAKAAIDIALHDVAGKVLKVPVSALLGGRTRQSAPAIRILALKPPSEVADGAASLVAAGYRNLKIKLEGRIDVDVARVEAVRARVGSDICLTADANQTYRPKEAIRALRLMEPHNLSLIEQPVAAADIKGLREVRRSVSATVEADEAANTLDQIARLLDQEAADSINLKIAHVGGLRLAQEAIALCRSAHVRCRLGGGTVGSQLLAAASLQLYAAEPSLLDPSEVAEWSRLSDDPASGLAITDGAVGISDAPGLGLAVGWPGDDAG